MTAKKKKPDPAPEPERRSAAEEFRAGLNQEIGNVVTWIQFAPRAGLVRANVERTAYVGGEKISLPGRDIDLPFSELSADIQGAVGDAIQWIAEDLGATVISPKEE